jgi:drug/metabolite transporter (DMT)-like permease
MKTPSFTKALFLTLAAPICWSLGGVGIRLISAPSMTIVSYRSAIMFLSLLFFLLIRDKKNILATFRNTGLKGLGSGLLCGATFICFVNALAYTTVARTLVLQGTAPIFAAVIGVLFIREQVSALGWGVVVISVATVIYMVFDSITGGKWTGDILALGAAVLIGINIVVLRTCKDIDMIPAACLGGFLSAVAAGFLTTTLSVTPGDFGLLVILGVVQLGLGFFFFVTGSKHLAPVLTGLITLLETLLAPIWTWLAIGETPSNQTLIGGSIIVLMLIVFTLAESKKNNRMGPTWYPD